MSALAAGLRELADWVEANPGYVPDAEWNTVTLHVHLDTREELVAAARALGGEREKEPVGDYFTVRRRFGPRVSLDFFTARDQVCRRVVVDTIEHPARLVPATVEEVVEWVCEDSLLAGVPA